MAKNENYPNAPYLTVTDPKRSIRFYEKLGFELGNAWPNAKAPEYASLVLDRQVVMIGAAPSAKAARKMGLDKAEQRRLKKERKALDKHRHGVGVQLYLRVPDPDRHHRVAKRAKVDVLRAPATHFYGIRDYVAADPDGYQLVFFATAVGDGELKPAPRRKVRRKTRARRVAPLVEEPASEPAPL